MKRCYKCKKNKGVIEFAKHKNRRDGLSARCKSCDKEYKKEYYEINKSIINEKTSVYYKNNSSRIKKQMKEYARINKAILKNYKRKWKKDNVDKVRFTNAKRRAEKLNATPKWLTKDQLKEIANIYKRAKELEKTTGLKYHVDHIVPLKGKNVCGLHTPWNLQILTAEENIKKGNRL